MRLVTRAQWRARHPRETNVYLPSALGVKVHYTGDTVALGIATDHNLCYVKVRAIQDSHMDGNDWNDIGYSALVCPHGHVFEGRGTHRLPAANGAGLNSDHYAVCGLVGSKGFTIPTPEMYNGIRDAVDWLRISGNAGEQIKCHKDGYATSCPGTYLTNWVRSGAPRKDTDVSAKEVWDYPVSTGDGGPDWRAGSILGHLEKEQDVIKETMTAKFDEITRKMDALITSVNAVVNRLNDLQ